LGLLDYLKVVDDGMVRNVYNKTINTLVKALPEFDLGYWSKYDIGKRIASPFYHKLHIAQLMVMYDISGIKVFEDYAIRWQKYYNSPLKRSYAFTKKAIQKIFE
jgi:heparosan-N-sulfate-glucuronate 5-epimerase